MNDELGGGSHDIMLCLGCGYDLRGLPVNRCPECGRGFDPERPDTYTVSVHAHGWGHFTAAVVTFVLLLPLSVLSAFYAGSLSGLVPAGFVVAVELYVAAAAWHEVGRPAGVQNHRRSWVLALLVSLLATLLTCVLSVAGLLVGRQVNGMALGSLIS